MAWPVSAPRGCNSTGRELTLKPHNHAPDGPRPAQNRYDLRYSNGRRVKARRLLVFGWGLNEGGGRRRGLVSATDMLEPPAHSLTREVAAPPVRVGTARTAPAGGKLGAVGPLNPARFSKTSWPLPLNRRQTARSSTVTSSAAASRRKVATEPVFRPVSISATVTRPTPARAANAA